MTGGITIPSDDGVTCCDQKNWIGYDAKASFYGDWWDGGAGVIQQYTVDRMIYCREVLCHRGVPFFFRNGCFIFCHCWHTLTLTLTLSEVCRACPAPAVVTSPHDGGGVYDTVPCTTISASWAD